VNMSFAFNAHRNYGVVASCPHCAAVNIPKKNLQQFTCGAMTCRNKQSNLKRLLREAKKKKHATTHSH
jgi:hypothetical protein